jgi:hypothetical protein
MDDAIYVIDRIEEGIAVLVCDSDEKMEVPLSSLPSGAHEGSCLRPCERGFALDEREEATRKRRIERKLNALFVD